MQVTPGKTKRSAIGPWLGLALAFGGRAAVADEVPWYERPGCQEINALFLGVEPDKAEERARKLDASKDPDDQACALWVRVSFSEFQLGLFGKTPENLSLRKKHLTRMFSFAKANKQKGIRFLDMELEARLRRTRILNEEGQRTQALEELRQLQSLVAERDAQKQPATPAFEYTRGVMNAALASPGWAARAVLSIAGLSIDPAVGAQHLHTLVDGDTVYRFDAAYVAHYFGEELGEKYFRKPSVYTKLVAEAFPTNPQFVYERSLDLLKAKDAKPALLLLRPIGERIDQTPGIWSAPIRAKVLYALARAEAVAGDKQKAKARAEGAKAEHFADLADKISDLLEELGS
ncbi:MAG: hypothetical protein U1E65_26405 [Myxococcota bacterium]